MACLEMYNKNNSSTDQNNNKLYSMSPRISFSTDFIDSSTNSSQHLIKNERRDSPVSSDFEFSVTNYSMLTADELFSKGRLLPFKDTHKTTTTIRDELLNDDNDDDFTLRIPKSSTRWKGLLGLKKSHIGSKKVDNNNQGSSGKRSNEAKNSQEPYNGAGGGSSSRDVEFRFN